MCKPIVITESLLSQIWEKGNPVEDNNPARIRKDACGAWIVREEYGNRDSIFGWEIDHIFPYSKLKAAGVPEELSWNLKNLRPLNCCNNTSKGIDFPVYHSSLEACDRTNVEIESEIEVNHEVQKELKELYKGYLDL